MMLPFIFILSPSTAQQKFPAMYWSIYPNEFLGNSTIVPYVVVRYRGEKVKLMYQLRA